MTIGRLKYAPDAYNPNHDPGVLGGVSRSAHVDYGDVTGGWIRGPNVPGSRQQPWSWDPDAAKQRSDVGIVSPDGVRDTMSASFCKIASKREARPKGKGEGKGKGGDKGGKAKPSIQKQSSSSSQQWF